MTTPDQIRFAYSSTFHCQQGHSIDDCLIDNESTKRGVFCEILKYLRLENNPFGLGKVSKERDSFIVIYKLGAFEVIVKEIDWNDIIPFSTVGSFAKWLNDCEEKILESAANLTFETFEKDINES